MINQMRRKLETVVENWAKSDNSRPILIQGARRVGKTFLVENCGKKLFGDGFVKLDFQTDLERTGAIFDGPTDDITRIISRISEYKRMPIKPESSMILFDEVQLCEKALNSLRFFADSTWKIAATGSLLGVTVKKRSLPFPSGVKHIRMYPMTFEEFLWAMGEEKMAEDIRVHSGSCEPYINHDLAMDYYQRYLVIGGMPKVVRTWLNTGSFSEVREILEEIDITYIADMTDPDNGISAAAAKRIWCSIPKQLLRSSTKKFKYSEVVRGGRRTSLLEPLEWLEAAGIILRNDLTCSNSYPLLPFNEDEGSYFKEYICDTGLMFYKFGVEPEIFLDKKLKLLINSDFRGALAENSVMQTLTANSLPIFYWMPDEKVGNGEVDFIFHNEKGKIVPVEVKSGRNVKTASLKKLIRDADISRAYCLSENNFSAYTLEGTNCKIREMPLYAAFCITE
ncbi:MAG: ATP-binding protein [Flexilinea sp.]|nr:ATP-binding protein [Flexilinea sp.]